MRGERGNEKREQRGKRTKDVGVGGSIDRAAFVYLIIEPTKKMTAKVRQPVALAVRPNWRGARFRAKKEPCLLQTD